MEFSLLTSPIAEISNFNCGDNDLNEFLVVDAIRHYEGFVASTYILREENKVLAYCSVLHDKLACSDLPSNTQWRKRTSNTNFVFNYRSYPALKIGRLAVDLSARKRNIGTDFIYYFKNKLINEFRTYGCRYITVDSYKDSIGFYERNGFIIANTNESTETTLMYFDLLFLK